MYTSLVTVIDFDSLQRHFFESKSIIKLYVLKIIDSMRFISLCHPCSVKRAVIYTQQTNLPNFEILDKELDEL